MEIVKNSIIKNKVNTKFLKVLLLFILFVLIYGTSNAYVYYSSLTPFGVGITFSLFYIGFNGYVLGIIFFLASALSRLNIASIIVSLNVVLVLVLLQYYVDRKRLKMSKSRIVMAWFFAILMYTILGVGDIRQILAVVVSIALGVLYLFASLVYFDASILKGMLGKVNTDEKICGGVILIVFGIGISNVYIGVLSISLAISMLIVLVASYLFSFGIGIGSCAILGIGIALGNSNPTYISLLIVLALVSYAFKCRFRAVSVLASTLSFVGYGLLFGMGVSLGEVFGALLGGGVYLLLPVKVLNQTLLTIGSEQQIALANVWESSKRYLVKRVNELGKVFSEMDGVYRGMVRGNLSDTDARKLLREELISGVCSKCPNESNCYRSNGSFMENCIDMLVGGCYEKGKVGLIDIPEYLATNCISVSAIVQYLNNLESAYLEYRHSVSNMDISRLLIADQLSGISRLLDSLSKEVDVKINFNNKYAGLIKEGLGYSGIVCVECVVYESANDTSINVIVKNNNVSDTNLEDIVSKVMHAKFGIVEMCDGELAGTNSFTLKAMPKFDIAFGSARKVKSGGVCSGDSHTVIDIGDGKYMLSICDGMGSGKGANKVSSLTINLIENFYRAGFDNDIILDSVNKLLSLTEQERFSTIDLCLVDCKKGLYDFVKLGATVGYIIRNDGDIEEIVGSGLPVGVLEDIRPHTTKRRISPMDIVVLMSDGVSDVLHNKMISILRNIDTVNPQVLADRLLKIALEENGGVAQDDMTVVSVRLFERI